MSDRDRVTVDGVEWRQSYYTGDWFARQPGGNAPYGEVSRLLFGWLLWEKPAILAVIGRGRWFLTRERAMRAYAALKRESK